MGKFLNGFWKGFGQIVSYKLIGPIQVVDVLMIFSFVSGIINGWGNSNALTGWILAIWFYLVLRLYEFSAAGDKRAIEDATEALGLAADALEMQREHIKHLEDTITALQTPKP
jgi:hypothetical protein